MPDSPREPLHLRACRVLVARALDHPVAVALACVASLASSAWLFDRQVTRGIPWSSAWGTDTYVAVHIRFPRGAGLERSDGLARAFEAELAALPEVERYETIVRPRFAGLRVSFPDSLEGTGVPVVIRERLAAFGHRFSGAEVRVHGYGPSFRGGGATPPDYGLRVLGYRYETVREIAEELAARLDRFPRIRDVDPNAAGTGYEPDHASEYVVAPDRTALARQGPTVAALLSFVSSSVRGAERGRLRLAAEAVPFAVRVAGWEERDVRELRELRVPTPAPAPRGPVPEVRLGDVARVDVRHILPSIRRRDQQYERGVAWRFRGPARLGDRVRDAVLGTTELPPGYRIEAEDRWGWPDEERTQVWLALGLGVALIYMVTAAVFESLSAPLVVLLAVPLALIGVFLAFVLSGASFTRTAYIGTIMACGIVVNASILLVHRIGELRAVLADREAILRGTLERVRPILMTALTTVFGLLPLVLFSGADENIWNAFALATIGGITSSTFFVLVAIPVACDRLLPGAGWRWARGHAPKREPSGG